MKILTVILCFMVILFVFVSIAQPELTQRYHINYFILFNIASLLLLMSSVYIVILKYRSVPKCYPQEYPEPLAALKSLFMHMPGAVMVLKPDFTIIDINQTVTKVTGLESNAISGKKCYEILGAGAICRDCVVQKSLISGKPEAGTRIEYKADGKQLFGKQTAIPIKDQNGHIKYIYEIVIDISQEVTLEKENSEILMDIVTALAHLIESRDPSTGTHSFNVQRIALRIGECLQLTDKKLKELGIAAILHDIGKIGIPESILNKPEALTAFEYSIIKQHSQIGYEAIKHIKRLKKVSDAILDHHEHYDGNGYPNRKSKEEISLIARIISVADVFEALTAERVYRKAVSKQQAIKVIKEGKGKQFDPKVVDAMVEVLCKGKKRV